MARVAPVVRVAREVGVVRVAREAGVVRVAREVDLMLGRQRQTREERSSELLVTTTCSPIPTSLEGSEINTYY